MIDPNDSPTNTPQSPNADKSNSNNAADAKSAEPAGFLTHLIELRDRLLKAVIVVGLVFIVLFPFASDIYDWLAAPLGRDLIIIGPVAPFLIPMKLTLLVANPPSALYNAAGILLSLNIQLVIYFLSFKAG